MSDHNQIDPFASDFEHEFDAEFESRAADRPAGCMVCEAMLPEAVDGTLTAAQQSAFDRHLAGCAECSRELAEAQRGAAWLSMLRSEAPLPPAGLIERILAETTGLSPAARSAAATVRPAATFVPLRPTSTLPAAPLGVPPLPALPLAIGLFPAASIASAPARTVPAWALGSVWRRAAAAFRVENTRASFQPRLAMTAAMAFFSIALTLNLTGVRLRALHAQDFTPSGLSRVVADAGASATRAFQNNRMVYQVESRMSELSSDQAAEDSPGPAADRSPAGR